MSFLAQLPYYLPGIAAYVLGLAAAGWLYPRRRAVALLLAGGVALLVLGSAASFALGVWFSLGATSDGSLADYAMVSAVVGGVSSLLHSVGIMILVAATLAAVTGWGDAPAAEPE